MVILKQWEPLRVSYDTYLLSNTGYDMLLESDPPLTIPGVKWLQFP